jgi:ribonuclease P protein subunit POP4
MSRTPENLHKHELIGLEAEVVESPDSSQTGMEGEVLNETKNTLNIAGKKIPKKGRSFRFQLPDEEVTLSGEKLLERPEDRL